MANLFNLQRTVHKHLVHVHECVSMHYVQMHTLKSQKGIKGATDSMKCIENAIVN